MDGISRSNGWDKEIPHGVLPMEQLVLSDKWARKTHVLKYQVAEQSSAKLISGTVVKSILVDNDDLSSISRISI